MKPMADEGDHLIDTVLRVSNNIKPQLYPGIRLPHISFTDRRLTEFFLCSTATRVLPISPECELRKLKMELRGFNIVRLCGQDLRSCS